MAAEKASYSRWTLPTRQGWAVGYIEDPRPHKILSGGVESGPFNFVVAMLIVAGVLAVLGLSLSWWAVGSSVTFGLIGAVAITIPFERNSRALAAAGIPILGKILFLKGEVPEQPRLSYQQAKDSRLFDSLRIFAPEEAFKRVLRVDPVIFGTIGDETFLIVAFDL
ncbi:MAG TPA: hypothetical protein VIH52_01445 [Candidatus Nanoarchaeia archaeon]